MEAINTKLKNLRIENGLSQSQVARDTGFSKAAISLWESGERIPGTKAIVALAKYYKVSFEVLLDDDINIVN